MDSNVRIAETPKGRIEYTQKGSGDPILFLHGSLENCNNDMGYDALLNAGFSIITPSRPGYGNTPAGSGKTAEEAADLCNALLDDLKIESVHVITCSYGGITGLHFTSKYPEKVKKLVMAAAVSKPIDDLERLEDAKRFYGKGHAFTWKMLGMMGTVSKKGLVQKTYELFSTCETKEIMKEITKQDMDAIVKFYQKKPENTGALIDLDHTITNDVLEKITAPTLIVHSMQDRAVPFSHAEHTNKHIKGSELFSANTWGHFVFIGKGSEDVLRHIIGFLQKESPSLT